MSNEERYKQILEECYEKVNDPFLTSIQKLEDLYDVINLALNTPQEFKEVEVVVYYDKITGIYCDANMIDEIIETNRWLRFTATDRIPVKKVTKRERVGVVMHTCADRILVTEVDIVKGLPTGTPIYAEWETEVEG